MAHTLRRTPTLPERHARRRATGPIRASRCVCLLCTHLSATSAPDQRPATAKPCRPLHGTRTALRPAARCPRRGSTSQKETYSPVPVGVPLCPLARPFCRTALGSRGVHPQRAAPCTAHRSYKTSRDTHTAPAPPRPSVQNARAAPTRELTPKLRTGRFRGHRDAGAEVERRREVRGSKKSLCTHKHRVPRAHPLPRA